MRLLTRLAHDPRCRIDGFDADGTVRFDDYLGIGRVARAGVVTIIARDDEVGLIGGRVGFWISVADGVARLHHGSHITIATVNGVPLAHGDRVLADGDVLAFFTTADAEALRVRLTLR